MQQLVRRYAEGKKCLSNLEEIEIYIGPIKMQKEFDYRPITREWMLPSIFWMENGKFCFKVELGK